MIEGRLRADGSTEWIDHSKKLMKELTKTQSAEGPCSQCKRQFFLSELVHGVCNECIKKHIESLPVEYVDYEVKPCSHNGTLVIVHEDDSWTQLARCLTESRFIAYVYADGTGSQSPRKAATNWNPALIPTHVRMAKEAE